MPKTMTLKCCDQDQFYVDFAGGEAMVICCDCGNVRAEVKLAAFREVD